MSIEDGDPGDITMGIDLGFRIHFGRETMSGTRWPRLDILGIKNDKIDSKQVLLSVHLRHSYWIKEVIDSLIVIADQLIINDWPRDTVKEWLFIQLKSLDTDTPYTTKPGNASLSKYALNRMF